MDKKINKILKDLELCNGIFDFIIEPDESRILVDYIKQLQKDNKSQQERIKYLMRSCNRKEYVIEEKISELVDLDTRWDRLKEYIKKIIVDNEVVREQQCYYKQIYSFMIELEQGDDHNVKN